MVNYTARGFGKSCGAQASRTPDCFQQRGRPGHRPPAGWLHLKDRRREAHDTQFLLGKLVDEGFAKPKRVGATGISYGGGESIELAYLRDRIQKASPTRTTSSPGSSPEKKIPMSLAAAFPRWPWSDLVSALLPNGRFLDFDTSTATRAASRPASRSRRTSRACTRSATRPASTPRREPTCRPTSPPGTPRAAGEPYSRPRGDRILNQIFTTSTRAFGSPAASTGAAADRERLDRRPVPAREALRVYNSLRAAQPARRRRAPVRRPRPLARLEQGEHRPPLQRPGHGVLRHAPARATEHAAARARQRDHVHPDLPGAGARRRARSRAAVVARHPPGRRAVRVERRRRRSRAAAATRSTGRRIDPIAGTSNACATGGRRDRARHRRLPAAEERRLHDDGAADGQAATIETSGDERPARLAPVGRRSRRQADPDQPRRLPARRQPERARITFQLHGNGWRFAAGHVPKLELLGQDAPYLRPSNGAFQVTVQDAAGRAAHARRSRTARPLQRHGCGSQIVQPVLGRRR